MLTFIKKTWLYAALLAVIAVLAVGLTQARLKNRRMQNEFYSKLQTAVLKSAVQNVSDDWSANTGKRNPYSNWMKAQRLAERYYKKSKGKFKKPWGLFLVRQSQKHGIDPNIVYQLLRVETGGTFNPKLVGPKTKYGRAYGMAQFMNNTAPWIAKMAGMSYRHDQLFNPYYSIELAVTYLGFLHDRYGNWDKALTAYNRGIYGMQLYLEKHGDSKSQYAMEITQRAERTKVNVGMNR